MTSNGNKLKTFGEYRLYTSSGLVDHWYFSMRGDSGLLEQCYLNKTTHHFCVYTNENPVKNGEVTQTQG